MSFEQAHAAELQQTLGQLSRMMARIKTLWMVAGEYYTAAALTREESCRYNNSGKPSRG
jgi:hypothetical protein